VSDPIILRYTTGQFVKPHFDTDATRGRRATCLVYLNDLPKGCSGGETQFPNLKICFAPKQGSAIVWNNTYARQRGMSHPDALHEGLPPVGDHAVKYAMQSWIYFNESYIL